MDERLEVKNMNKLEKIIQENFKSKIFFDEKLSKYSWFNLGGPAEIFFKPDNLEQLTSFLKEIEKKKPIYVIGAGSNTLIRDGGIEGVTIKLSPKFSFLKICDENIIEVGAATLDKKLSDYAAENSISGFEFLSCIPGSVGGAIKMNSGCYGDDISKIFFSLKCVDFEGKLIELGKDQINFSYRGCDLKKELIIISAKFKGQVDDKKKIELKKNEMIKKKKDSQPNQIKTCGSTFKNPIKEKAWSLIKRSNCDKISVGNAKISEKHCNFFVNNGNASSNEIEELIEKVKNQVFNKTGVNLDLEIKIVGKKSS